MLSDCVCGGVEVGVLFGNSWSSFVRNNVRFFGAFSGLWRCCWRWKVVFITRVRVLWQLLKSTNDGIRALHFDKLTLNSVIKLAKSQIKKYFHSIWATIIIENHSICCSLFLFSLPVRPYHFDHLDYFSPLPSHNVTSHFIILLIIFDWLSI